MDSAAQTFFLNARVAHRLIAGRISSNIQASTPKYARCVRNSFSCQQYGVYDWGWEIETPAPEKLESMTKVPARKFACERSWSVRLMRS